MTENLCDSCDFLDIDYIWDDEDGEEYEVCTCSKTGKELTGCVADCELYKKYRVKRYKEKFYVCDSCDSLQGCINSCVVLEMTTCRDTMRHYMPGMLGCPLRKG